MAANNPGLLINPKSGIPLYVQLKSQIKHFISAGVWEPGLKLPTERELAETLGVSRNTVSAAYKELEAEGFLVSLQGRGTFVAGESSDKKRTGRKERLLRIIDLALEEAAELGFNPDDFLALAVSRAQEQKELLSTLRLAFVAPAGEQAEYFKEEFLSETGVQVVPFLLAEIRERPEEARQRCLGIDLIVTTLGEVEEVERLLKPVGRPVVGVSLELELGTIVRIARMPAGSTLVLLCSEESFGEKVKQSLQSAGINGIKVQVSTDRSEGVKTLVGEAEAVAVSIDRLEEVKELAGKEVIPLRYRLDAGSLNMLRCLLLDLRKRER